ncbi:hypothetical protein C5167_049881, partial [Papaver somniferum]
MAGTKNSQQRAFYSAAHGNEVDKLAEKLQGVGIASGSADGGVLTTSKFRLRSRGSELPERSYCTDCRIYVQENTNNRLVSPLNASMVGDFLVRHRDYTHHIHFLVVMATSSAVIFLHICICGQILCAGTANGLVIILMNKSGITENLMKNAWQLSASFEKYLQVF